MKPSGCSPNETCRLLHLGVMNPERGAYIGHGVYVIRSTTSAQLAKNGSLRNICESENNDAARKKYVSHNAVTHLSWDVRPARLLSNSFRAAGTTTFAFKGSGSKLSILTPLIQIQILWHLLRRPGFLLITCTWMETINWNVQRIISVSDSLQLKKNS